MMSNLLKIPLMSSLRRQEKEKRKNWGLKIPPYQAPAFDEKLVRRFVLLKTAVNPFKKIIRHE